MSRADPVRAAAPPGRRARLSPPRAHGRSSQALRRRAIQLAEQLVGRAAGADVVLPPRIRPEFLIGIEREHVPDGPERALAVAGLAGQLAERELRRLRGGEERGRTLEGRARGVAVAERLLRAA